MNVERGSTVGLEGTTLAEHATLAGTVVEEQVETFADSAAGIHGNIQARAVMAADGTVQLSYRVVAVEGGTVEIVVWTMPGPTPTVDVDYRIDGLGEVGPSRVGREDQPDGSGGASMTLRFDFDRPVTATAQSRFVHLITGTHEYQRTGTLVLEGPTDAGGRWRAEVAAFSPVPSPTLPSRPPSVIGTISDSIDLGINVDALATLPSMVLGAAGHAPTYPLPDKLVRLVLFDVESATPRQIGMLTIPDSSDRRIHALLSDDRNAYLVLEHVESEDPLQVLHRDVEVIVIDPGDPTAPQIVSRTSVANGVSVVDAALAGGAVWLGTTETRLAGVDVRDARFLKVLPPRPIGDDLKQMQGWITGSGDLLHYAAETKRGPQVMVTVDVDPSLDAPRRVSVAEQPAPWGLSSVPGIVVSWDPSRLTLFLPNDRGAYQRAGDVEVIGDAAAATLNADPARLFVLSVQEPRVEVWELTAGTSVRIGLAEHSPTEAANLVRPKIVLVGHTLCFTLTRQLRTLDVTNAVLGVEQLGGPEYRPPPSRLRVPRPPR